MGGAIGAPARRHHVPLRQPGRPAGVPGHRIVRRARDATRLTNRRLTSGREERSGGVRKGGKYLKSQAFLGSAKERGIMRSTTAQRTAHSLALLPIASAGLL